MNGHDWASMEVFLLRLAGSSVGLNLNSIICSEHSES